MLIGKSSIESTGVAAFYQAFSFPAGEARPVHARSIFNRFVTKGSFSGNANSRYFDHFICTITRKELSMKQWLSAHILAPENFRIEESLPMSDKEFYISLSMVCTALALFGVLIHFIDS
jgi:hypothetical protein